MEHIIPLQIGGKLWARFLCKPCNDRLGSEAEPAVKSDPAIRFAVEHLKEHGSVVQPDAHGRKHIATVMRKEGHTEERIGEFLSLFDRARPNKILHFGSGAAAIRRRIDRLEPVADGRNDFLTGTVKP